MEFNFATTEDTYPYCCEVVDCLVTYCNKTQEESLCLINLFWKSDSVFDEYHLRLHEYPYYWARGIAHHPVLGDNKPEWYHDSQLWPPPAEYLKRYSL